ncbi:hypothetical protein [Rhizobium leguminosarum]
MSPHGERFLLIILVFMSIALLMFVASSCATRYQPMGENVWRAL